MVYYLLDSHDKIKWGDNSLSQLTAQNGEVERFGSAHSPVNFAHGYVILLVLQSETTVDLKKKKIAKHHKMIKIQIVYEATRVFGMKT